MSRKLQSKRWAVSPNVSGSIVKALKQIQCECRRSHGCIVCSHGRLIKCQREALPVEILTRLASLCVLLSIIIERNSLFVIYPLKGCRTVLM